MEVKTDGHRYYGHGGKDWLCSLIPSLCIGYGKVFFTLTFGFLFWDFTIEFNWEK